MADTKSSSLIGCLSTIAALIALSAITLGVPMIYNHFFGDHRPINPALWKIYEKILLDCSKESFLDQTIRCKSVSDSILNCMQTDYCDVLELYEDVFYWYDLPPLRLEQ